MIDVDYLDDNVLNDILENTDLETVRSLSREEAFDRFLNWNGIIGYTETLMDAHDNITTCWTLALLKGMTAQEIRTHMLTEGHRGDDLLRRISESLHLSDEALLLVVQTVLG